MVASIEFWRTGGQPLCSAGEANLAKTKALAIFGQVSPSSLCRSRKLGPSAELEGLTWPTTAWVVLGQVSPAQALGVPRLLCAVGDAVP